MGDQTEDTENGAEQLGVRRNVSSGGHWLSTGNSDCVVPAAETERLICCIAAMHETAIGPKQT